jgi:TMEM175 potassium channel family protein
VNAVFVRVATDSLACMTSERSATSEAARTSIDRLMFFSDAVVAIAITLLAIDLPVPSSNSAAELGSFVEDHLSEYLAFLVSFLVIAQAWRAHHGLYRYVRDTSRALIRPNTLWLLTIVLTPYATRVLYGGEDLAHGDMPWRFAFYALVQALAAGSFLLAQWVIEKDGLLDEHAPPGLMPRGHARSLVLVVLFLGSIPFAFWLHAWAFAAWCLIPVGMRVGERLGRRRRDPDPAVLA